MGAVQQGYLAQTHGPAVTATTLPQMPPLDAQVDSPPPQTGSFLPPNVSQEELFEWFPRILRLCVFEWDPGDLFPSSPVLSPAALFPHVLVGSEGNG